MIRGKALVALVVALAQPWATPCGQTPEDGKARIARLEKAVLAPCCYTEPVSHHQSNVALKMSLEIARSVQLGKSDQEILGAFVERYGARVLVDSRTLPSWWTTWVPWSVLMVAIVAAFWILCRWRLQRLTVGSPAEFALPNTPALVDQEDFGWESQDRSPG
jgi:cytochrome c-type biogenesis protein CcmH/NrfF